MTDKEKLTSISNKRFFETGLASDNFINLDDIRWLVLQVEDKHKHEREVTNLHKALDKKNKKIEKLEQELDHFQATEQFIDETQH